MYCTFTVLIIVIDCWFRKKIIMIKAVRSNIDLIYAKTSLSPGTLTRKHIGTFIKSPSISIFKIKLGEFLIYVFLFLF